MRLNSFAFCEETKFLREKNIFAHKIFNPVKINVDVDLDEIIYMRML